LAKPFRDKPFRDRPFRDRPFRELGRSITQMGIRNAIELTRELPAGFQSSSVRSLVSLTARVPMLRARVRRQMLLALGQVPPLAERRFFQHVGWSLSNSLVTFHHGLAAANANVIFNETINVLDEAIAEKRGVILASPHWSGHEILAAIVARRHPMVMLIRQGSTPDRVSRKVQWYRSLGVETVLRPKYASTLADAVAYLKVLRSGKILAITPDLLADPGDGTEISIFNRPASLKGGAFWLSIASGAPMIRPSIQWQLDSSVIVTFERAPPPPETGDRETVIRACAQDWCHWFEGKLHAHPENWLFWLDKRWSRFLRTTPPMAGAK
jgi:lauroyl/myristoyl acyltransferase